MLFGSEPAAGGETSSRSLRGDFNKRIFAYAKHRQTVDFYNAVAAQYPHRMCNLRSTASDCFL